MPTFTVVEAYQWRQVMLREFVVEAKTAVDAELLVQEQKAENNLYDEIDDYEEGVVAGKAYVVYEGDLSYQPCGPVLQRNELLKELQPGKVYRFRELPGNCAQQLVRTAAADRLVNQLREQAVSKLRLELKFPLTASNPDEIVWCCPECHSVQVQRQMWVDPNTDEVVGDTERYSWCDHCSAELNHLARLTRAETLDGLQVESDEC